MTCNNENGLIVEAYPDATLEVLRGFLMVVSPDEESGLVIGDMALAGDEQ